MASTTLSLSPPPFFAPSSSSKLTFLQNPLSISLHNLNYTTSTLQRLHLSSINPAPAFSPKFVPKAGAETEAAVRRDPDEVIEEMKRFLEEAEAADPPKQRPPRPQVEQIFAVVMIGSRQYIVFPGRWITTQRLKGASANDKIILNKVLLVGTKDKTYIGKPVVTNAVVHAVVEEQLLDDKVIVFKYKAKKNYRRNIGHRQPITRIKITGITGYEDFPAATLEPEATSS
ncbi:hypothetical protein vseg_004591 [Gypsophila vaccaria]